MTTSTASDLLNLSSLPPDIIRMIVRDKDVSLRSVALISKSWNRLIREYRNQFPVLEILSISFEMGAFCIGLIVGLNDSEYLKKYLRSQEYIFKECPQMDGTFAIKIHMPVTTGSNKDEHKWDYAVSRCIGRVVFQFRRVASLYIAVAAPRFLRIFNKARSGDLKLEILVISTGHFGIALRTFTLDLIKHQKFNEFTIYAHYCDDKMGEFLLQMSKHTSILRMAQLECPQNALCLFGKLTSYWQKIACEMTENGMMRACFGKAGINHTTSAISSKAIVDESSILAKIMQNLEL